MTCSGCGNDKAHWIRRIENWERCDLCSPDEHAPSTGNTVDRYLAYKSRNSLNPPIIPTLPQPAMEHARVIKKLEAQGKLKGRALAVQKAVQEKLKKADFYRSKGLSSDGKKSLSEVNANDNLHAMPDGSIENDAGKKLESHRWEVIEGTKKEPEMREVTISGRNRVG